MFAAVAAVFPMFSEEISSIRTRWVVMHVSSERTEEQNVNSYIYSDDLLVLKYSDA